MTSQLKFPSPTIFKCLHHCTIWGLQNTTSHVYHFILWAYIQAINDTGVFQGWSPTCFRVMVPSSCEAQGTCLKTGILEAPLLTILPRVCTGMRRLFCKSSQSGSKWKPLLYGKSTCHDIEDNWWLRCHGWETGSSKVASQQVLLLGFSRTY